MRGVGWHPTCFTAVMSRGFAQPLEPTVIDLNVPHGYVKSEGADGAITLECEVSDDQQAELLSDVLQTYQALSAHPRYAKLGVHELFVVATLDAVALTPEGSTYLSSLVEAIGGGLYHVSLVDDDGQRLSVIVGEPRSRSSRDVVLTLIERAIATVNAESCEEGPYPGVHHGSLPLVILAQLGLTTRERVARAVRGFSCRAGDTVRIGNLTMRDLAPYRLAPMHAYTVVGTYQDRTTGESMLVLHDLWGTVQPLPIPESAVEKLFGPASFGTLLPLAG